MSLVAAKCPNCGASIMLDAGSREGFCTYCGSKLRVQEVIGRVKIDKTGDAANYLALAEAACEGNNADEAYEYANKAIEVNAGNVQAWLHKLKALEVGARTALTDRSEESVACGNKILSLDPSLSKEVYQLWLSHAKGMLDYRTKGIPETTLYAGNSSVLMPKVLLLRRAVPAEEIAKDKTLEKQVTNLAKALDDYQYCLHRYDEEQWRADRPRYEQCLAGILEGLPEKLRNYYGSLTPFFRSSMSQTSQSADAQEEAPLWVGCLILIFVVSFIFLLMKGCVALL